jgi:hypothetical protein
MERLSAGYGIRPAREGEVEQLPGIEREAAGLFASRAADLGLPADRPPDTTPVDTLRVAQAAGRLWVAVDADDRAVGFAFVREVDGLAHLEELDVRPARSTGDAASLSSTPWT